MSSCNCALLLHAVVSCLTNINDLLAVPTNGQQNISSKTLGSTVTYSCDAGYKLIGSSTVTCLAHRKWPAYSLVTVTINITALAHIIYAVQHFT